MSAIENIALKASQTGKLNTWMNVRTALNKRVVADFLNGIQRSGNGTEFRLLFRLLMFRKLII